MTLLVMSPFSSCIRTKVATLSRGQMSIVGGSQVSVNGSELLLIDMVRLSFRIVRSKCAGSENSSDFFLLLQVLLGMHLKEIKKKNYEKNQ